MKSARYFFCSVLAAATACAVFVGYVAALGGIFVHETLRVAGIPLAPLALGANSYTNLVSDVYAALDVVSRELVGFIPSVTRNSSAARCALNANALRGAVVPANTAAGDITAAMALPSAADTTVGNKSLQITKARFAPFSWTGEDQVALNSGPGYLTVKQDNIAQAMRALVNEIETDVAAAARKGASRACGTAGTTPFASNLEATALAHQIIVDNGGPAVGDRHLIINTTTGVKVRSLGQLQKVNEAGSDTLLRQGQLLDVNGFVIRESAQLSSTVTKGTGTSYQVNKVGGYAVGDTAITVDTGSGTILAGDVITFAGDDNKYVVASALASNVVTIAAPGLRKALADNAAITVGDSFQPNVAFSRSAIQLATRLPALPEEGDMAIMRETITDDRSGLSFELAVYPGYRMVTYHLMIAWGQLVAKPEHVALLLG